MRFSQTTRKHSKPDKKIPSFKFAAVSIRNRVAISARVFWESPGITAVNTEIALIPIPQNKPCHLPNGFLFLVK